MVEDDFEDLRANLTLLGVTSSQVEQVLQERRAQQWDQRQARSRRRWWTGVAVAAAACLAFALTLGPPLLGDSRSSALALGPAPTLSFPFILKDLPDGLDGPVFEHDGTVSSIRFQGASGEQLTLTVGDEDDWSLPRNAPTLQLGDIQARVLTAEGRTVLVWQAGDRWLGLSGRGALASPDRLGPLVAGVAEQEQAVRLPLTLAPVGWQVEAYKEGRTVTLRDAGGRRVTLTEATASDDFVADYGVDGVDVVTVGGRPGLLGTQSDSTWVLESVSALGRGFSLLGDPALSRQQVLEIAGSVREWSGPSA